MGGWNGKERLKSVEVYDPRRSIWKNMKEMNECRSGAAAAVANGKIFCCGGYNGTDYLKSAECYDSSSDVWTLISDMPGPSASCGVVIMDEHLIVIGGRNKENPLLDSVWILNTTDKNAKWFEGEPRLPRPLCDFSIAKIDVKIFVCGGIFTHKIRSHNLLTTDVEVFDGEVRKSGPKLTTFLQGGAAAVIPIQLARHLEQFVPDSSECSIQ